MKSPFTGKEMKKVYEKRTWNFRGEMYEYTHASWLCEDTGEMFFAEIEGLEKEGFQNGSYSSPF